MKFTEITFTINELEKIILTIELPLEEVHCCTESPIYLEFSDKRILLSQDSVRENMYILSNLLTKALDNQLILDKSITADIGYLYNQELQGKDGLVYKEIEKNVFHWVGGSYSLWSYNVETWLYNKDGAIIFEVTPIYPGNFFVEPGKEHEIVPYDQWIKNYEPLLIRQISKHTAQVWLEQANSILQLIETNMKRMKIIN